MNVWSINIAVLQKKVKQKCSGGQMPDSRKRQLVCVALNWSNDTKYKGQFELKM
jgi:hypothetical protein